MLLLIVTLLSSHCWSQDLILVENSDTTDEASVDDINDEVSTDEVFVATDEWQEVKPGQRVPSGLHVRLNIETGKKEAKKLVVKADESGPDIITDDHSHEALKEALKNIKADFTEDKKTQFDPSQFRSMEELKEALGEVNMNVETDVEIITKLVNQFNSESSDLAMILEDLEYYLHQYDNALLFVDLGGLTSIIIPSLNSSNTELRSRACQLVSGAAQSNPRFQVSALQHGLMDTLLRITVAEDNTKNVANKVRFFNHIHKLLIHCI